MIETIGTAALTIGGVCLFSAAIHFIGEAWTAHNTVRRHVWSNLDAGREHFDEGGALHGETPGYIALNMTLDAPGCQDYEPETLLPHVQKWMRKEGLA